MKPRIKQLLFEISIKKSNDKNDKHADAVYDPDDETTGLAIYNRNILKYRIK